ncbi:hypothetical protein [Mycobacterium sp.]|uniref:hypothetical protein n=1 Tax=Mycobacterium sp. TaxID=1785 RepID=UPI0025D771B5|nr:hypothetical protein [Mycobacterium sp.]
MAANAARPVPAGPHSDEVIPPYLWPMAHNIAAELGANYRSAVAEQSEPVELAYRQAAKQIEDMAQGGAAEGIAVAHLRLGIDHGNLGELRNTLANALVRAAEAARELSAHLEAIDHQAHDELAAAPAEERPAIIAKHRARAETVHHGAAATLGYWNTQTVEAIEPLVAGIVGRTIPDAPPPPPNPETPDSGPGPVERRSEKLGDQGDDVEGGDVGPSPAAIERRAPKTGDQSDGSSFDQVRIERRSHKDDAVLPSPPVGFPGGELSSAGGLGGFRSAGGLSGLGSGGGLGSLGPSGGLSSLMSGGVPGAQATGLSGGLPSSLPTAPQAATSAGAFSQGVSAGSSVGSSLSSLPPATGIGSGATASTTETSAATPAAGLSTSTAPSTGLGAAGASFTGSAAGQGIGGPAMMVPPPGMGAPAASVSAGPGVGTSATSAGSGAASSGGSLGSAGGPAVGAGQNNALLVPASVHGRGNADAGRRQRTESAELASAKALALKLRRDCDGARYPVIEWAVGMFRGEAGGATECAVMSNEGFGYTPWGVFLPRATRLLATDPLADSEFRAKWFGCNDAGQVLAEYAKLRTQRGSHLLAVGLTTQSGSERVPGVEYGICPPRNMNENCSEPVLDDMHAHRLEVLHPDLFTRVQRLTDTDAASRAFASQVCVPLAIQMIDAVQMSTDVQTPPELRQMWDLLGTGDTISDADWQDYLMASMVEYVNLSAGRPRHDAGVAERERYHAQWVCARTMEFLRGWRHSTPDVADMIYAAAAAYPGDFGVKLEPLLRVLEDSSQSRRGR